MQHRRSDQSFQCGSVRMLQKGCCHRWWQYLARVARLGRPARVQRRGEVDQIKRLAEATAHVTQFLAVLVDLFGSRGDDDRSLQVRGCFLYEIAQDVKAADFR